MTREVDQVSRDDGDREREVEELEARLSKLAAVREGEDAETRYLLRQVFALAVDAITTLRASSPRQAQQEDQQAVLDAIQWWETELRVSAHRYGATELGVIRTSLAALQQVPSLPASVERAGETVTASTGKPGTVGEFLTSGGTASVRASSQREIEQEK